jgi:hypothetical protein
MEKKSVVITPKGYSIKVADHMLGDLAKFGATTQRPVLKPTPKEILNMPKKVEKTESNLPKMQNTDLLNQSKIEAFAAFKKTLIANKEGLVAIAKERNLPEVEWSMFNKKDLTNYLIDKYNEGVKE